MTAKKTNSKTTKRKPRATKPKVKPEGLGDVVESVLNSPVIKPVKDAVKSIIWKDGEDCGCDERKERLNKKFSFAHQKPVRCLTEEDFGLLSYILPDVSSSIGYADMTTLSRIHASVFNYHFTGACATCVSRNRSIIEELKVVLKETEEGQDASS